MEVAVPDDEGQVSEEVVQMWCVEEQAMETDIALLQQVEELEKKVTAASLQVKVNTPTHMHTNTHTPTHMHTHTHTYTHAHC